MAEQQSYADFSIVYKYFEQKRIFDNEVLKYEKQIAELKEEVRIRDGKIERREAKISELDTEKTALEAAVREQKAKLSQYKEEIIRLREENAQLDAELHPPDKK